MVDFKFYPINDNVLHSKNDCELITIHPKTINIRSEQIIAIKYYEPSIFNRYTIFY